MSHNVHALLHLADDEHFHGPLNTWTVFPLENRMAPLKRMIRKADRPLEQPCNRVHEQMCIPQNPEPARVLSLEMDYIDLDSQYSDRQYRELTSPSYALQKGKRDGCCIFRNSSIVKVCSFSFLPSSDEPHIIGQKFARKADLYRIPWSSSALGISVVSHLSETGCWPVSMIVGKCLCIKVPFKRQYVVFPLVHMKAA